MVQNSSGASARGSGCVGGRAESYDGDEGQLDVLHAAERVEDLDAAAERVGPRGLEGDDDGVGPQRAESAGGDDVVERLEGGGREGDDGEGLDVALREREGEKRRG